MPILTLQQRNRELGRIRIGQQVPTGRTNKDGEPTYRPEKLDRFRLTSASRPLLDRVAQLYGGEVREWDNNGAKQFEAITTATRLPIIVPPQPVSQYFELWSGGGCQRRCDGETELLKDRPCLCGPDPTERKCKPTTRLNVILRDVEGIGVWRLESHGYYSATELPGVADFLAKAGSYVSAWLSLEARTVIRDGKTRRWLVPTIEVDITPAALLSGTGMAGQIGPTQPIPIERGPVEPSARDIAIQNWVTDVKAAESVDALRELWRKRPSELLPPEAQKAFTARAAEVRAQEESAAAEPSSAMDELWMEALNAAPEDWSVSDVERHFTEITGVEHKDATAKDLRRYLDTAYPAVAQSGGAE